MKITACIFYIYIVTHFQINFLKKQAVIVLSLMNYSNLNLENFRNPASCSSKGGWVGIFIYNLTSKGHFGILSIICKPILLFQLIYDIQNLEIGGMTNSQEYLK